MDKATKNKLWLMVIIALVIIGMLLTIVFNQLIPFLSSKKELANQNIVGDTEKIEDDTGYTYLGKEEVFNSNLLSKEEFKSQLNIGNYSNNVSTTKILTGISNIELFNNYLIEPINENSILSILDEKYKTEKKIDSNNVKHLAGQYTFIPIGTSASLVNNTAETFIFYGYRVNEIDKIAKEYGYIVTFNYVVKAFSIAPYEFQELKDLLETKELKANANIEQNIYNKLSFLEDSAKNYSKEVIRQFKYNTKYMPELAYVELDNEYSNKFGSAKAYQIYINKNKEKFDAIEVSTSIKKVSEGIITYTCTDRNQNKYFITTKEKDFFDFKIKFSNIIL